MNKSDVLRYYGGLGAVARALGITPQAVWQWPERIPELRAYQIERLTGGALTYDGAPAAGADRGDLAAVESASGP